MLPDQNNLYKGSVAENYVIQHLAVHTEQLFYFKPSDNMEIDLMNDDGVHIVPIEIKAGRYKKSRSLMNYIERYRPAYAIRISALNFGTNDMIRSVPLYAVFCLNE